NTIRNFDLVALQNLRVRDPGKLDLITEQLNARGRHYEYVISPGQASSTGVFNAFLFDRASIEVDRDKVFDWVDPHQRFNVRPLSAMFRVRGPATNQAFTFVAINVYIDPTERENELGLLPEVLDAVKQNYPGEDDMILFGSFQAAPGDLGVIENEPGMTHVAEGLTSMVQNDYLADNLLFDRRATIEYVGDWGVYDLGRGLKLKPAQTLDVTRHLPVWAKFSIYEGGRFIK
ncbi:MAG: hypothetical protein PVH19_12515, partial [Planctomycetia bacterium]